MQRRLAREHLGQRRLAQEGHALFLGRALDLRPRLALQDHLADAVRHVQQLGDRRPAAVAGAVAVDAALALVEREVAVARRDRGPTPRSCSRVGLDRPLAGRADQAHQPLGQDAVQRRDEVVRLDVHVQEAADDVDHVVGVDRGEDQVAGQRRLDGDLRRLLVADLADHDLVRVVAQDRAQPAGEGQPLLLVDRDLGDARQAGTPPGPRW